MDNRYLVTEIRRNDPKVPASTMAKDLGISRERVRQLLKELGLKTNILKCGKRCPECGQKISSQSKLCRVCFLQKRFLGSRVNLLCDSCGKRFLRLRSEWKTSRIKGYRFTFCNRRCQGHYLGIHSGFGNRRKNGNNS